MEVCGETLILLGQMKSLLQKLEDCGTFYQGSIHIGRYNEGSIDGHELHNKIKYCLSRYNDVVALNDLEMEADELRVKLAGLDRGSSSFYGLPKKLKGVEERIKVLRVELDEDLPDEG